MLFLHGSEFAQAAFSWREQQELFKSMERIIEGASVE